MSKNPRGRGRAARRAGTAPAGRPARARTDRRPRARERAWVIAVCCALLLATGAVYGQVAHHAFLHFDDDEYIYDNPHVSSGLNWANVAWAFTAYHSRNWHPLTWLSHMLDCQLFGLRPGPHHLVSVLLHALDGVVLFLLLRRLTGALWRSALVAALFAVHPMHVESVAWAAERKDVLSALFALLTIAAYAAYARTPTAWRYGATLLLFALGLMAKPMLVTLPLVLLLLDAWPLGRFATGGRAAAGRLVLEKVPMLALAAASSALTFAAQSRGGVVETLEQTSLAMRVTTALVSYVRYAAKLAVPTTQAFYYPRPETATVLPALGAAVVLALATYAVVRLRRRAPYAAVGWFWYLGTLVPVIGLVQVGTQAMADRYSYLPSIGLFLVLAWGLADVARRWPAAQRPLVAAMGVVLCLFAVKAWAQTRYWRDGITLFTRDTVVVRDNLLGSRNLGVALCDSGRFAEAVPRFQRVLRTYPHDAVSLLGLGRALDGQGESARAADLYRESLRYKPDVAIAHYDLGNALLRQGRVAEALAELDAALALRSDLVEAVISRGNALSSLGRYEEAAASYAEAVRLRPSSAGARNNLGATLLRLGRREEAARQFAEVLRLDPTFAAAESNLGLMCLESGDTLGARAHFERAARLSGRWGPAGR